MLFRSLDLDKIKTLELEFATTKKQLGDQIIFNENLNEEKNILVKEIQDENKARLAHQQEVERLVMQNNKLNKEKNDLDIKLNEFELNIQKLEERNTEITIILDAREKDLSESKKLLSDAEIRNQEAQDEIDLLKNENADLI